MGKDNNNEQLVYHYCSMSTFKSIIENKTLRLSDMTKSNDSKEIRWVIDKYLRDILEEEYNKAGKRFQDRYDYRIFQELTERYIKDYFIQDNNKQENKGEQNNEDERYYDYFACCFSDNGDLLSQWRGYADDGNGVALGFSSEMLKKIGEPLDGDNISSTILTFNKIKYTEKEQKATVRKIAIQLINALKEMLKTMYDTMGDAGDIRSDSMIHFNKAFFDLFRDAALMKNPFFKEEKEWRLGYFAHINQVNQINQTKIGNGYSLSRFKFMSRPNYLIPCIDLYFGDNPVLREVILGPENKESMRNIRDFLDFNGFLRKQYKNEEVVCNIKNSKGSYRKV